MSKIMENIKTANSVVRTMIFLVLSAGLGYGGFLGYQNYVRPSLEAKEAMAKFDQLQVDFQLQKQEFERIQSENDRFRTSLQLLKIDRRLANVEVMDISENESGEPTMNVRFTEYDEFGEVIGASRDFELRGDTMYLDCWVVKFGDKYVEQADALRSASLCVFKGIYGNLDGPQGTHPLDSSSEGDLPSVYASDEKSAFEAKIWSDFWKLANDEESQQELGIRAIHGQANYVRVKKGKTYEINVRSSGAASLEPVGR